MTDRERARDIAGQFFLYLDEGKAQRPLRGGLELAIGEALAAVRAETIEQCAKICRDADLQDEIDNGAAMTGAARIAERAIRSLKTGDTNV